MAKKNDGYEDAKRVGRFLYICLLVVMGVHVASRIGANQPGGGESPVVVEPPPDAAPAEVAPAAMLASAKATGKAVAGELDAAPEPKPESVPEPAKVAREPAVSVDPVSGFHASVPAVIMLSTPGCAPCKTWEAANGGKFSAMKVKYFSVDDVPQPSYPAFRVYDGKGRWHGRTGSRTTFAEIMSLIKG